MRRLSFGCLALASLMACGWAVTATARPRYGGTLRVQTHVTLRSLDPASWPADPVEARVHGILLPLVFETLVRLDAAGSIQPSLASSWERDAQATRWQFQLRPGVKLHDGTTLTPAQVAAALRQALPAQRIRDSPNGVVIESDRPMPDLLWSLVDPRQAIAVHGSQDALSGTGAFRVEQWEAGRRAVLRANEEHWAGRPFLDGIDLDMGRPARDQLVSLELGRADVATVLPLDVRRLAQRGVRVRATRPLSLLALAFEQGRPLAANERARRSLALAVNRHAICSVLLQGQAEPAWALLPQWLSGYASLTTSGYDQRLAKSIAESLPADVRTVTLQYETNDAVLQTVAERVAVDAREAGISVRIDSAPARPAASIDVRLVRIPLEPGSPEHAMVSLAASLGLDAATGLPAAPVTGSPGGLDAVRTFEQALVDRSLVVPLVHLPDLYGFGERVESWNGPPVFAWGGWNFSQVCLRPEKR